MKVLICGAGIAGLALAWHLEQAGCEVVLVERAPAFRDGGYIIDFFGPGYEVAQRMGIADRVRALRHRVNELRYVDRNGRTTSSLDVVDTMGDVVSIQRGDLARTIHDVVRTPVRYGTSVARCTQDADGVDVELTDGTRHRVDLLVGADGVHSHTRELAFGPVPGALRHLDHHAAAFVVRAPHLARQVGQRYQMLTVPGRMAGAYALDDERVTMLFLLRAAGTTPPADPAAVLRERFGDLGWILPEVLAACPSPPDLYYDPAVQVVLPRWNTGRVVLLGDACQAVSLFAGHGASLAVAGAHVLAHELTDGHDDLQAALARYQERMVPAVADAQRIGQRMVGWMAPDSRWRITARDWMMRIAGLPGVRGRVMDALTPGGHGLLQLTPRREVEVGATDG